MLGAIIGGVASVASSIFGGKKKEKTVNTVDYKRMVKDAEAAGFNPLTALRNGGAAGFSISETPGAPLSSRIIDGVASGVNTFLANFDPHKDQAREQEYSLIQAQIANLNASTASYKRGSIGGVPTMTGGTSPRNVSAGIGHNEAVVIGGPSSALPASAGKTQTPTIETPTITNPARTGSIWDIDPAQPDAAAFEERYGEPGDWIGGVLTFGTDLLYNGGRAVAAAQKKYGRDSIGVVKPFTRPGGGGW